jgi:hypothetical protein
MTVKSKTYIQMLESMENGTTNTEELQYGSGEGGESLSYSKEGQEGFF